jgi:hypothetical protein
LSSSSRCTHRWSDVAGARGEASPPGSHHHHLWCRTDQIHRTRHLTSVRTVKGTESAPLSGNRKVRHLTSADQAESRSSMPTRRGPVRPTWQSRSRSRPARRGIGSPSPPRSRCSASRRHRSENSLDEDLCRIERSPVIVVDEVGYLPLERQAATLLTHVVDPLPERVRLIKAPGELRDVELEVLGWRTEHRELVLNCRLIDGSAGTIPARWTDLPRRAPQERPLGVVASPAAWLLLGERLEGLRSRCPARATAPRRKRRSRCRDSSRFRRARRWSRRRCGRRSRPSATRR